MDPKKRLQVIRANSPSLRQSVTPKKKLDVIVANQGRLTAEGSNKAVKAETKAGGKENNNTTSQAQHLVNGVNSVGRFVGENTAKVLNTTEAVKRQILPTIQQAIAAQRGDTEGFRKASEQIAAEQAKMQKGKGGVFNAGGVVTGNEFRNDSAATNARKFAGTEVASGVGEILPWLIGAKEAELGAKGVKGAAKIIGINAGLGAEASAAEQVANNGKIDAKQTAIDAGVAGSTAGLASGIGKVFNKIKGKLSSKASQVAEKIEEAVTPDNPTPQVPKPAEASNDLSTVVKANIPKVALNSSFGKAMQQAFIETGIKDPYNLAVNAIARMGKKTEVREVVGQLLGENPDGTLINRITRKLTNAKTAQEVSDVIEAETKAAQGVVAPTVTRPPEATPEELAAPSSPEAPTNVNPPQANPLQGPQVNEPSTPLQASQTPNNPNIPSVAPTRPNTDVVPTSQLPAQPQPGQPTALTKAGTPRADGKVEVQNSNMANATPEAKSAVDSVLSVLGDASKTASKNAKSLSADRAGKVGAADAAGKSVGGQEGYYAALSKLKGKSPKETFDVLKDKIDQKQVDALFSHVQNLDSLRPFEKINVQTALAKVFGSAKGAPTKGDIKLIEKAFGPEMAKAIEDNVSTFEKVKQAGFEFANIPRALLSAFDFSAPFRQGIVTAARYPKEFFGNFKNMFKTFGSEKAFQMTQDSIANGKNYELMRKSGLALSDLDNLDTREEQFMSNYAEKIPLAGKGVRASGRAYTAFLNKTRADVFDRLVKQAGDEGLDVSESNKLTKDIATFVNSATGRGSLGPLESSAKGLSALLFSPRLWASRINLINPSYYAKLEPFARKQALQSMAAFAGSAATVLSLAKAAGAEVEADPRSADFGKIKIGNTRYDILGGFQQNIVLLSRLITGQKVNSVTGEASTLGEGYGKPTRLDLSVDFLKNKLNPIAGFGAKVLTGKQPDGEPLNIPAEAARLFVPLNAQDAKDLYDERGPLGVLMAAPGLLGFGSNTYGERTTNGGAEPTLGTNISKGDNATASVSGEKGNNVTDTITNQKKAESDSVAAYKKKLSGDDQSLLAASKNDLDSLLKDKKINQKQYDRAQKLKDDVQKLKGTYKQTETKVPDGVKSTNAAAFYKKYQSVKAADRKDWLASDKVDGSAKKIADEVNKQRPSELPAFKATNQLAKDYADFEAKTNAKNATDLDKQNALKSFLTKSVKNQYSENAKDIYAEGNSEDFKNLLDNGSIDKKDLEEAIAIDNALYDAHMISSLKFSKKSREALGYDMPKSYTKGESRSGVGSGSSGGSSGGSSESTKAYLTSYLTDFKAISSPPTISSKPKRVALAAPSLPATGGKAKVSIRL